MTSLEMKVIPTACVLSLKIILNCSKCGLTTALVNPNWLRCHTSFPDKATGNCYVKKIMLTLRIIFHILSECSFFSPLPH